MSKRNVASLRVSERCMFHALVLFVHGPTRRRRMRSFHNIPPCVIAKATYHFQSIHSKTGSLEGSNVVQTSEQGWRESCRLANYSNCAKQQPVTCVRVLAQHVQSRLPSLALSLNGRNLPCVSPTIMTGTDGGKVFGKDKSMARWRFELTTRFDSRYENYELEETGGDRSIFLVLNEEEKKSYVFREEESSYEPTTDLVARIGRLYLPFILHMLVRVPIRRLHTDLNIDTQGGTASLRVYKEYVSVTPPYIERKTIGAYNSSAYQLAPSTEYHQYSIILRDGDLIDFQDPELRLTVRELKEGQSLSQIQAQVQVASSVPVHELSASERPVTERHDRAISHDETDDSLNGTPKPMFESPTNGMIEETPSQRKTFLQVSDINDIQDSLPADHGIPINGAESPTAKSKGLPFPPALPNEATTASEFYQTAREPLDEDAVPPETSQPVGSTPALPDEEVADNDVVMGTEVDQATMEPRAHLDEEKSHSTAEPEPEPEVEEEIKTPASTAKKTGNKRKVSAAATPASNGKANKRTKTDPDGKTSKRKSPEVIVKAGKTPSRAQITKLDEADAVEPTADTTPVLSPPKILFSGSRVPAKNALSSALKRHGVKHIEDPAAEGDVFLCVGEGQLKPTAKLLYSLLLGRIIVTDAWAEACAVKKKLVSPNDYLPEELRGRMDIDRTKLLAGKTIYLTPALKKEYGKEGFSNFSKIAKLAGAETIKEHKGEGADSESILLGLDHDDSGAQSLIKEGSRCLKKEVISTSIIKGELDLENSEFVLTASPSSEKKRGRRR